MAVITLPEVLDRAGLLGSLDHDRGGSKDNQPDPWRLVGSIVDRRYLVEARAGSGGFGVVYRARHIQFDSPIALKVFVHELTRDSSPLGEAGGASPLEGRLLFRLAPFHSSFVRVYESGLITRPGERPLPYLAMEWLDGVSLKAHWDSPGRRRTGLPLTSLLHLFDDLAEGLAIAHRRHVTHRDLKPGNVFLSIRDGHVLPKLLDFGLAKQGSASEDAHDDTSRTVSPFTPAYGAPEQWLRSLGATGAWTDVYALALMGVELLAGRRWHGDASGADLMPMALDSVRRPTPRTLGVDVSPAVEAVFARALSVDPRNRYRDAGIFWKELCGAAEWRHPGHPVTLCEIGMSESWPVEPPTLGGAETVGSTGGLARSPTAETEGNTGRGVARGKEVPSPGVAPWAERPVRPRVLTVALVGTCLTVLGVVYAGVEPTAPAAVTGSAPDSGSGRALPETPRSHSTDTRAPGLASPSRSDGPKDRPAPPSSQGQRTALPALERRSRARPSRLRPAPASPSVDLQRLISDDALLTRK